MDKRQALAILVQKSQLFDDALKADLLAKIPTMEESDVTNLGVLLAVELRDTQKNIDADIANSNELIAQAEKLSSEQEEK